MYTNFKGGLSHTCKVRLLLGVWGVWLNVPSCSNVWDTAALPDALHATVDADVLLDVDAHWPVPLQLIDQHGHLL